jgi:chromosomal replication initiation ATPase DnaA
MTRDERLEHDAARARLACHMAAYAMGAEGDLLTEERGAARTARARQVAMYLTHVAFGMSLHRVAVAFGRDRSTVAHACHLMEDRRDDAAFDDLMSALEASLRAAPPPVPVRLAA